jgi:hypothetical protein
MLVSITLLCKTYQLFRASDGDFVSANPTISWTGGTGTYSVYVNSAIFGSCNNISATSCTVTLPAGNSTIYVRSNDQQSAIITVKR